MTSPRHHITGLSLRWLAVLLVALADTIEGHR